MTRGKRIYSIVVADSHSLFRRGLATLIAAEADLEVRGEAATAAQALAFVTLPAQAHQSDLGDGVLWDLPRSAKGSDASRQGSKEQAKSWGGEVDAERVLRASFGSPKGSDASRQGSKEQAKSWGGELDAEPVLRVSLGSPFQPIDILVMEIAMAQADPDVIKALRQLPETTSLLLLASEESPACLETTVATGARAYMIKTAPPVQLIRGIRQAAPFADHDSRGLSRQAPDLNALAATGRSYSRTLPLTAREQEVTTLLAEGRTVREVAVELALSIKTIEAHKLNLMRKLDIHNRASLVDYAVRSGLITVHPLVG